jgi:hypothetical protein
MRVTLKDKIKGIYGEEDSSTFLFKHDTKWS